MKWTRFPVPRQHLFLIPSKLAKARCRSAIRPRPPWPRRLPPVSNWPGTRRVLRPRRLRVAPMPPASLPRRSPR
ncbi:hypothetical protein FGK64_17295 [Arenibacterium halophilum]|uniref:Uncharacterized protein n=1 Tax=Arenibacterium halophilum TaxID=2583821 RepID=A0ABY2X5W0_9RHOB|nr:hypothetical protein FGK64_17295 [Arenibacterium halophilum]